MSLARRREREGQRGAKGVDSRANGTRIMWVVLVLVLQFDGDEGRRGGRDPTHASKIRIGLVAGWELPLLRNLSLSLSPSALPKHAPPPRR